MINKSTRWSKQSRINVESDLFFDGATKHILIPVDNRFDFGTEGWAISFILDTPLPGSDLYVFDILEGTNPQIYFTIGVTDMKFLVHNADDFTVMQNPYKYYGQKVHVVLQFDGTNYKAYFNTNEELTLASTNQGSTVWNFTSAANFAIGSRSVGTSGVDGNISQFAWFNRPLTTEEIESLHTQGGLIPDSAHENCILHYPLNQRQYPLGVATSSLYQTLTSSGVTGQGIVAKGFSGDGYIEWTCGTTKSADMNVGLVVSEVFAAWGTFDYSFIGTSGGLLFVRELGVLGTQLPNYVPGDTLRIERSGTEIKYYLNGILGATTTGAVTTYFNLAVDSGHSQTGESNIEHLVDLNVNGNLVLDLLDNVDYTFNQLPTAIDTVNQYNYAKQDEFDQSSEANLITGTGVGEEIAFVANETTGTGDFVLQWNFSDQGGNQVCSFGLFTGTITSYSSTRYHVNADTAGDDIVRTELGVGVNTGKVFTDFTTDIVLVKIKRISGVITMELHDSADGIVFTYEFNASDNTDYSIGGWSHQNGTHNFYNPMLNGKFLTKNSGAYTFTQNGATILRLNAKHSELINFTDDEVGASDEVYKKTAPRDFYTKETYNEIGIVPFAQNQIRLVDDTFLTIGGDISVFIEVTALVQFESNLTGEVEGFSHGDFITSHFSFAIRGLSTKISNSATNYYLTEVQTVPKGAKIRYGFTYNAATDEAIVSRNINGRIIKQTFTIPSWESTGVSNLFGQHKSSVGIKVISQEIILHSGILAESDLDLWVRGKDIVGNPDARFKLNGKYDIATNNVLEDLTGNGNNAQFMTTSGTGLIAWDTSKLIRGGEHWKEADTLLPELKQAFRFTGTGYSLPAYLHIKTPTLAIDNDRTVISFSYPVDGVEPGRSISYFGGGASADSLHLLRASNHSIGSTIFPFNVLQIHADTLRRSDKAIKRYVNGVLFQDTLDNIYTPVTATPLYIGGFVSGWNQAPKDFYNIVTMYFNRVLSQKEIVEITSNLVGKNPTVAQQEGLVCYYNMNLASFSEDGTDVILKDYSGNGNDATVLGLTGATSADKLADVPKHLIDINSLR